MKNSWWGKSVNQIPCPNLDGVSFPSHGSSADSQGSEAHYARSPGLLASQARVDWATVPLGDLPALHPKVHFHCLQRSSLCASCKFLVAYFNFLFDSLVLLSFLLFKPASHKTSTFDLNFVLLIISSPLIIFFCSLSKKLFVKPRGKKPFPGAPLFFFLQLC